MNFQELRKRFIVDLRDRVQSGQLSERGLAKVTGVSQPHIHNVLKGKRRISPEMCDAILQELRMDVLDLVHPEDLLRWRGRQ